MNPLIQQQLVAATEAGIAELHRKTMETVQRETAITWAGRAAASYVRYAEGGDLRALMDAEEFHHEALEHAALVVSDPSVIDAVRHYLMVCKADALAN